MHTGPAITPIAGPTRVHCSAESSVLIFGTGGQTWMTNQHRSPGKSSLAALFPSMAMARLVIFFAVHPGARYHVRELSRLTGLSSASLQHELKRLAHMGALVREDEGARAYYRADE